MVGICDILKVLWEIRQRYFSSDELQVPFLVAEESINHPFCGFNATKIIINNTRNIETLIVDLQSNVVNVESNNIETFVKFITIHQIIYR